MTYGEHPHTFDDFLTMDWGAYLPLSLMQKADWHASDQAAALADSLVAHQLSTGGYRQGDSKGICTATPDQLQGIRERTLTDSTFNDHSSTAELRVLAIISQVGNDDGYHWRSAAARVIEYILESEYPRGGWPVDFPKARTPFGGTLTYADWVIPEIMHILWEIMHWSWPFGWASEYREQATAAFDRGIKIICRTQILHGTTRTGWAQHYDPETLEPVEGRHWEPPVVATHETVGVIMLLQRIIAEAPGMYPGLRWVVRDARASLWGARLRGPAFRSGKISFPAGCGYSWGKYYDEHGVLLREHGVNTRNWDDMSDDLKGQVFWLVTSPGELFKDKMSERDHHGIT